MASKKESPKDSATKVIGVGHVPTPDQLPQPKVKSKKAKPPASPKAVAEIGEPINSFPVGKIFTYEGKKWQKAAILQPGTICRCLLVIERDGGLYVDPSVRIDLAPKTKVIP